MSLKDENLEILLTHQKVLGEHDAQIESQECDIDRLFERSRILDDRVRVLENAGNTGSGRAQVFLEIWKVVKAVLIGAALTGLTWIGVKWHGN